MVIVTGSTFSELALFNPPGWGSLPIEYRKTFNYDFEQGMLKVASEQPHNLPILQRAMSAFFFNFQPRNSKIEFLAPEFENNKGRQAATAVCRFGGQVPFCARRVSLDEAA